MVDEYIRLLSLVSTLRSLQNVHFLNSYNSMCFSHNMRGHAVDIKLNEVRVIARFHIK